MTETIRITIPPTGTVTVETDGFVGRDCEEATRPIERELGVVSERERKPEYYRRRVVDQSRIRSRG